MNHQRLGTLSRMAIRCSAANGARLDRGGPSCPQPSFRRESPIQDLEWDALMRHQGCAATAMFQPMAYKNALHHRCGSIALKPEWVRVDLGRPALQAQRAFGVAKQCPRRKCCVKTRASRSSPPNLEYEATPCRRAVPELLEPCAFPDLQCPA